MSEFFKGWRRKAGVLTLVMACVFAVGWVRSLFVDDNLRFESGPYLSHRVGSDGGCLLWNRREYDDETPLDMRWRPRLITEKSVPSFTDGYVRQVISPEHWQLWDVLGIYINNPEDVTAEGEFYIKYRTIVIPLTLLSAYLLLGKPRVAKPKKTVVTTPSQRA